MVIERVRGYLSKKLKKQANYHRIQAFEGKKRIAENEKIYAEMLRKAKYAPRETFVEPVRQQGEILEFEKQSNQWHLKKLRQYQKARRIIAIKR